MNDGRCWATKKMVRLVSIPRTIAYSGPSSVMETETYDVPCDLAWNHQGYHQAYIMQDGKSKLAVWPR